MIGVCVCVFFFSYVDLDLRVSLNISRCFMPIHVNAPKILSACCVRSDVSLWVEGRGCRVLMLVVVVVMVIASPLASQSLQLGTACAFIHIRSLSYLLNRT